MTNHVKFRENFELGVVEVFSHNMLTRRFREYSAAATWAQNLYRLTDDQLMEIYRDYKEDYDAARD